MAKSSSPPRNLKPDKETAEKNRKGCGIMLLKLLAFIAGVYILEIILRYVFNAFQEEDVFLAAMRPYQNSYFSFNPYFTTTQDLGNEYSGDVSAAFRFLVALVLSFIIYSVLAIILAYTKPLKPHEDRIRNTLFYFMIAFCLIIAFFVPQKKVTFDRQKKEMSVTIHKMFVIPETVTIPFSAVPEIRYEYSSDDDLHGELDHVFLRYYIQLEENKIILADRDLYYEIVTPSKGEKWKPTRKIEKEAKETAALLNQLVKGTP